MVWNAAHIHLMINHLPIFALDLAIPLLLLALWKREEKAIFLGAVLLMLFGTLGGIGSVLSGDEAEEYVEGEQGVSMKSLSEHEELAEVTSLTLNIVGIMALFVYFLKKKRPELLRPEYWIIILLIGALVGSTMAGLTALEGGKIRHPEIRPGASESILTPESGLLKSSDAETSEDRDDDD